MPYNLNDALSSHTVSVSGHSDHRETETRAARVCKAPCTELGREARREIESNILRWVFRVSKSCRCCQTHSNSMACVFVVRTCITGMLYHGQYLRGRYAPPYQMSPLCGLRRRVGFTVKPIYFFSNSSVACETNK